MELSLLMMHYGRYRVVVERHWTCFEHVCIDGLAVEEVVGNRRHRYDDHYEVVWVVVREKE